MTPHTLEGVPGQDIPAFLERQQDERQHVDMATLPATRSSEQIITQTLIQEEPAARRRQIPGSELPKRISMQTTDIQRRTIVAEDTPFIVTKSLSYYRETTHLQKQTLKRLVKGNKYGDDITSTLKRGRRQKYNPELLKSIASKLCAENMTLRATREKINNGNIEPIGRGDGSLPEEFLTTIHRYVSVDNLMREVNNGPLSLTEKTRRDHL